MKELNLREIQMALLNLMVKMKQILCENNLQYFLAYGTLLGAVRHRGFIPWDDDIDIWMPRKDVNKLIKIMEDNCKEYYPIKLLTRKNTSNYVYGIPRVTDLRYVYQSGWEKEKMVEMGIFIDIYPIDNYGNNRSEGEKIYYATKMNWQYAVYVNSASLSRKHTVEKYLFNKILHILHGDHWDQTIEEKIENFISERSSDNDRFVGVPTWDVFGVRQYERVIFSESDSLLFEGHDFNIPKQYDKVLTMIYGDYMQLPPEDKRVPHHNYKILER